MLYVICYQSLDVIYPVLKDGGFVFNKTTIL